MAGRAQKPKRSARTWYSASLIGVVLTPKRGGHRVVTTIGEEITEESNHEPTAMLRANLGDKLMVAGADEDEIAIVKVEFVEQDGWNETITIAPLAGKLARDGRVKVLRIKTLTAKQKRMF